MIRKQTLTFLKELAGNNNREWFLPHKEEYEAARANVLELTAAVIKGLAKTDQTIPADLDAKNCTMRIYRDVRFSKDKTPYKLNFGIAISGNGKNFNGPGYYIHVEPGKSFIAGGHWMPEAEQLKAIRQEIDYNGTEFREILADHSFKSIFSDLSAEDKLKSPPKGYAADHPDIEYLKLKSFTASRRLTDKELLDPAAGKHIVDMFESLYPLMVFLRNAIA